MSKIAIVYHSTYGHTKLQAEAVFRGAQSVPTISAQLYTAPPTWVACPQG